MLPLVISENKQALFDHVVLQISIQGQKSWSDGDGTTTMLTTEIRCPLGWCLTPMALKIAQEESLLQETALSAMEELLKYNFGSVNLRDEDPFYDFVAAMSDCHDVSSTRAEFVDRMEDLAASHGISVSLMDQLLDANWCLGDWEVE